MRGAWGKATTDAILSAALLVLSLPCTVACAALIWLVDGPPVLFRQERVGRRGRHFQILKFRTMRGATGPPVTTARDPRVTRIGRLLRRCKLDELPQLWNVLVGDMSLVGPRPEVPEYVARAPHAYRTILGLRPGITDFASVVFRDEEDILGRHHAEPDFYARVMLPRKLALARLYRRRRWWLLDLGLVLAAVCVALRLDDLGAWVVGQHLVRRARAGVAGTRWLHPPTGAASGTGPESGSAGTEPSPAGDAGWAAAPPESDGQSEVRA